MPTPIFAPELRPGSGGESGVVDGVVEGVEDAMADWLPEQGVVEVVGCGVDVWQGTVGIIAMPCAALAMSESETAVVGIVSTPVRVVTVDRMVVRFCPLSTLQVGGSRMLAKADAAVGPNWERFCVFGQRTEIRGDIVDNNSDPATHIPSIETSDVTW